MVLAINKPKRGKQGDDYESHGKQTNLSKKSKEDNSVMKQYETYEIENRSILGGNDIFNAGYANMMRKEDIKKKEAKEKAKLRGDKMSKGTRSRMGNMSTNSNNISPSVKHETLSK